MARPKNCRAIGGIPGASYYKPKGVPYSSLEEIVITLDEFEAVKLADYELMYQQDAAESMGVSRQTFGRIIDSAHKKIADALFNGKALRIEGGDVRFRGNETAKCVNCKKEYIPGTCDEESPSCPYCSAVRNV